MPLYQILLSILLVSLSSQTVWAFDFTDWDTILKRHVRASTVSGVKLNAVDYAKLKIDPDFAKLISRLDTYSIATLASRDEKIAFWINAYNIMAVRMVIDHYPLKSIKSVGNLFSPVWKMEAGKVGGKGVSLNEIEHDILRKMGEPKIHVAIVCASVSCPDLRTEPYIADKLSVQLDDQLVHFLENPNKGMRIDRDSHKVYLSLIFDWFADDFGGKKALIDFLIPYSPPKERSFLKRADMDISFLDYNWNLNVP